MAALQSIFQNPRTWIIHFIQIQFISATLAGEFVEESFIHRLIDGSNSKMITSHWIYGRDRKRSCQLFWIFQRTPPPPPASSGPAHACFTRWNFQLPANRVHCRRTLLWRCTSKTSSDMHGRVSKMNESTIIKLYQSELALNKLSNLWDPHLKCLTKPL